jgi:pyroglutamyl-peptidase
MVVRRKIVLTGFGPFPGVADNATATLVPCLAAAARELYPQHEVISEILPTEWNRAPARLRALLAEGNVALMLHFGVVQDATGFRLERVGRNIQAPRQDAAGELPASACVIDDGPAELTSTWPAERIAARLSRLGLPCVTSDNAGAYLCNALLYHSLAAANETPHPHVAGFVHVPSALIGHGGADSRERHPPCGLDLQMAVAGGLEIIATCLEHLEHLAHRAAPVKTG